MQIKPNILKIPEDNPFSDDKLNRSQAADVLTQLVSTIREPFVLAIDSPWGTGKSTFISMWMASLRKNGFPCLCFNAWDSDFTGDPLVSFIGEMQTGLDLSHLKGEARSKADAYFSKSTQLLGTFAKKSAPLLVKVLTRGALEVEDLKRLIDLKGFGIEDLAGSLLKDKIEQYEDNKNTIKVFKAHLKDFATHLANGKDGAYKPLCFFIDELDRCRPTYAIELLEKSNISLTSKGSYLS